MALFEVGDHVSCDFMSIRHEGCVIESKKFLIRVKFEDGEIWKFSLQEQRDSLRHSRGKKRGAGGSDSSFGRKSKTSRTAVADRWSYEEIVAADDKTKRHSSYQVKKKAKSKNKEKCRKMMLANLPKKNSNKHALVLDAEDMLFTKKLINEFGFRSENIDIPNCNEGEIIKKMRSLDIGNVYGGTYMGDFLRDAEYVEHSEKYDIVFADYCGMPGRFDKINSPLHDLQEMFSLKLIASNAVIGITVCLRNNTATKIRYQNMHMVSNAVIAAAYTHGFVATVACQNTYKDKGSQTMVFVCLHVTKL